MDPEISSVMRVTDSRTWMFRLMFLLLAVSLLTAVWGLSAQTRGMNSGLVVAGSLLVLSFFSLPFASPVLSTVLGAIPAILAMAMLIAWGGTAPFFATSALCWTGVVICFTCVGALASRTAEDDVQSAPSAVARESIREVHPSSVLSAGSSVEVRIENAFVAEAHEYEETCLLSDSVFNDDDEEHSAGGHNLLASESGILDRRNQNVAHWARSNDGEQEFVEGTLLLILEPGEKYRYIHVPVVPFFNGAPVGECECVSDGDVVAEFDSLHPYGGRIALRRRGDLSEPLEVELGVMLQTIRTQVRAA